MEEFDMDGFVVLLIPVIVVTAILTTGIRIVKPGEVGFVYRGRRFVGFTGPAFVFAPPVVGRVYRMKEESLHIVVESSVPKTEVLLEIANPSIFPITEEGVLTKIRNQVSESVLKILSHRGADDKSQEDRTAADDIRNGLTSSFREIGLIVKRVKVGNHNLET